MTDDRGGEGTEFDRDSGEFSYSEGAFIDCQLCEEEVFNTRVGKHLYSAHWEEICELAEQ